MRDRDICIETLIHGSINESRVSNKRHPDGDIDRAVRGQGSGGAQQGAVPDGFRRGRYLSGPRAQDHAGPECGFREHRTREGCLHPLSRSGQPVLLVAEGGRQPSTRQARHQGGDHEAGTQHREVGQAGLLSSGGADCDGADSQGGHLDQGPSSDGRHFARGPQRRAGSLHVQDLHFAEDTFQRNQKTPASDRGERFAEEFRRHHTHCGRRGPRCRHRARYPFAPRAVGQSRRQHSQESGSRSVDERDEPREYHNPRLSEFDLFSNHGRRRGDVSRD